MNEYVSCRGQEAPRHWGPDVRTSASQRPALYYYNRVEFYGTTVLFITCVILFFFIHVYKSKVLNCAASLGVE